MKSLDIDIQIWIILHAFLMLLIASMCLTTSNVSYLLIVGIFSFLLLVLMGKDILSDFQPFGGFANWITFSRLLLLVVIVATLERWSNIQLFGLFSICLLLDGVDGWAARKFQQESEWGALFDKEVDSFFVLVVSMILYQSYQIPFWIILIGILHYLYELVLCALKWQHIKTKKNPIGRYVAFLLFIGLLCPLIVPSLMAKILLIGISILVSISFGISFFFKFQQFQLQR